MTPTRSAFAVALPIALLAAMPAFGQSASVSAGSSAVGGTHGAATGELQSTKDRNQPAPVGTVLGVPVVITAPMDAPYNSAAAFSTYEGQSGFGPNSVLAAADAGAP